MEQTNTKSLNMTAYNGLRSWLRETYDGRYTDSQDNRTRKALSILQSKDGVSYIGNGQWIVADSHQGSGKTRIVTRVNTANGVTWSCGCPDVQYNDVLTRYGYKMCKHVRAVMLYVKVCTVKRQLQIA